MRWLVKRSWLVAFLSLAAVAGCGGHGPKVQHGDIEVFYKEGATKEEADRLGSHLAKAWGGMGAGRRSVQLTKPEGNYQFRLVVKPELQTDDKTLRALEIDGARVSRDVFGGVPIEVHSCDEHFKTVKALPHRPDLRYGVVEKGVEVFYAAKEDEADARRLALFVAKDQAPGAGNSVSLKLARRGDVNEVYLVFRQELLKTPGLLAELAQETRQMSREIFKGAPVELHLCDEVLNVVQVVSPDDKGGKK